MGEAYSTHKRDEKCIKNISGENEGYRQLQRIMHTMEDNIKM
jgi:hypothetical protein